MRAYLANDGYGLTVCWSRAGGVLYDGMALGGTVGEVHQFTQNEAGGNPHVYFGLMGDPTLRQHTVDPASEVEVSSATTGVDINWTAASGDSSDSDFQGYLVYRTSVDAAGNWGEFERVSTDLVTGTTYNDTTGTTSGYVYMVRAVKLENTNLGSYFNASQGSFSTPIDQQIASDVLYCLNVGGNAIAANRWEGDSNAMPSENLNTKHF